MQQVNRYLINSKVGIQQAGKQVGRYICIDTYVLLNSLYV